MWSPYVVLSLARVVSSMVDLMESGQAPGVRRCSSLQVLSRSEWVENSGNSLGSEEKWSLSLVSRWMMCASL